MKIEGIVAVALLTLACTASEEAQELEEAQAAGAPEANPVVVLATSLGDITVELFPEEAPETVANFLLHVRNGFYNDLIFHRVRADLNIIQAGEMTTDMRRRSSSVFPIANEADNGLRNERGTIAMARTMDPHSATSQFFINAADNPQFDFTEPTASGWGYAVFGTVIDGIEVVDAIVAAPVQRQGRFDAIPVTQVVIDSAYVRDDG